MKKMFPLLMLVLFLFPMTLSSLAKDDAPSVSNTLLVYCYDSFASEWGPGPAIVESFEEATGIEIILEAPGDAVTLLTQLELEKKAPRADVVIGLDNNLLDRTLEQDILIPYKSPMLDGIREELIFDDSYHLIPFDWGFFAFCYDSENLKELPQSLEDLTKADYKDSIILMDPRTSTPGMGFFLWVQKIYGDQWMNYWERLAPNVLTIAESWSTGYGFFTGGEAPLVLSYSSSPAYHVEYEGNNRYQSLIFEDGHPVQIEGAGIVKGTKKEEMAQLFLDYLLNEESQKTLALSNIMFPVKEDTPLPASFDYALKSETILDMSDLMNSDAQQEAISQWLEIMSR